MGPPAPGPPLPPYDPKPVAPKAPLPTPADVTDPLPPLPPLEARCQRLGGVVATVNSRVTSIAQLARQLQLTVGQVAGYNAALALPMAAGGRVCIPAAACKTHRVAAGQYLYRIAQQYATGVEDLVALNPSLLQQASRALPPPSHTLCDALCRVVAPPDGWQPLSGPSKWQAHTPPQLAFPAPMLPAGMHACMPRLPPGTCCPHMPRARCAKTTNCRYWAGRCLTP